MITEFERSPSFQGYYISSNGPQSGTFVRIESVEAMLTLAYMHGVSGCDHIPDAKKARQYSADIIRRTLDLYEDGPLGTDCYVDKLNQ